VLVNLCASAALYIKFYIYTMYPMSLSFQSVGTSTSKKEAKFLPFNPYGQLPFEQNAAHRISGLLHDFSFVMFVLLLQTSRLIVGFSGK